MLKRRAGLRAGRRMQSFLSSLRAAYFAPLALVIIGSCFAESSDQPRTHGGLEAGVEADATTDVATLGLCAPARPLQAGAGCHAVQSAEPLQQRLVVSVNQGGGPEEVRVFTDDLFRTFEAN